MNSENENIVPRVRYVGDGVTKKFPFLFMVFQAEDVDVYIDEKLQENAYAVNGVGNKEGGEVEFASAPRKDAIVTIIRNLDIKRTSEFLEGGAFRAKTINHELDYQVACMQQLDEKIQRSVVFPPYSKSFGQINLPEPEKGKAIIWGEDDKSLVNSTFELAKLEEEISKCQTYAEASKASSDVSKDYADEALATAKIVEGQVAVAKSFAEQAEKNNFYLLGQIVNFFEPRSSNYLIPLNTIGDVNGTLITNCDTRYPSFWKWLVENKKKAAAGIAGYERFNKTQAQYDAELVRTNLNGKKFCTFFVVDETAKTVRLPLIGDAHPRGYNTKDGYGCLDQMQGHWHNLSTEAEPGTNVGAVRDGTGGGGSGSGQPAYQPRVDVRDAISDGVNGTPKVGDETRPRSFGLFYYIVVGNTTDEVDMISLQAQLKEANDKYLAEINAAKVKAVADINQNGVDGRAMTDMSNAQVMPNSVVYTPQNVNVVFDNATGKITLKAGSKLQVPNGTGFDELVTKADLSLVIANAGTREVYLFGTPTGGITYELAINCFVSATQPTVTSNVSVWFDTTNKLMKRSTDKGITWTAGYSLPFVLVQSTSNVITSVIAVFNAVGYFRNMAWAVKGIKCVIPNGFKDGVMDNILYELPITGFYYANDANVKNMLFINPAVSYKLTSWGMGNNTRFSEVYTNPTDRVYVYNYVKADNQWYYTGSDANTIVKASVCPIADFSMDASKNYGNMREFYNTKLSDPQFACLDEAYSREIVGNRVWVSDEYTPVKGTQTIVNLPKEVWNAIGFSTEKARAEVLLKCAEAEANYAVGDYAQWNVCSGSYAMGNGSKARLNETTVAITTGDNTNGLCLVNKTTGVHVNATLAKWKYVFVVRY